MELNEKSTKELLALHNTPADKPAGPKAFSTPAKLLARIRSLSEAKGLDLRNEAFPGVQVESGDNVRADAASPHVEVPEPEPPTRVLGFGELAKMLLMDSMGYPHVVIAGLVNAEIVGAKATANSVRWYAAKMRKEGMDVPPRSKAKVFPVYLDEKQSKAWLKTIRVVEPGE